MYQWAWKESTPWLQQRIRLLDMCMVRFITCDPIRKQSVHLWYIGSSILWRDTPLLRGCPRSTANEIVLTCSSNSIRP